jgi:hypothetical protein
MTFALEFDCSSLQVLPVGTSGPNGRPAQGEDAVAWLTGFAAGTGLAATTRRAALRGVALFAAGTGGGGEASA